MIDVVIDLLKRHVGTALEWLWDAVWFWRLLALVVILACLVAVRYRGLLLGWLTREGTLKHDATIFTRLDAEAPELFVGDLLNSRMYNGWFWLDDMDKMADLSNSLERIENRFLHPRMREKAETLGREIKALRRFTVGTFSKDGEDRAKFYPDLIEKGRYDRDWARLQDHLTATRETYKQYRLAAKEVLKV